MSKIILTGKYANYMLNKISKDSKNYNFWELVKKATCQHDYKGNDDEYRKCTICGCVEDYEEAFTVNSYLTQGCHNCLFLDKDGGDSVPYGSTSATLPECEYCTCPATEGLEDKALEDFEKEFMNKQDCPHWEGKLA